MIRVKIRVKICGLTDPACIEAAAEAGAGLGRPELLPPLAPGGHAA